MSTMSSKPVHIYKVSTVGTGLLSEGQQKSFLLYYIYKGKYGLTLERPLFEFYFLFLTKML